MKRKTVTFVGGGNGAHAAVAIAGWMGHSVRLWAPFREEAEAWRRRDGAAGFIEAVGDGWVKSGRPDAVSDEPGEVVPGSDMVVFVLPAFAHKHLLERIRPFVGQSTAVGAMPSRSGFEFLARSILGKEITVFGVQTLPWACRISEYGRRVAVMGVKRQVSVASAPGRAVKDICDVLRGVLDVETVPAACMLEVSLGNVGQIVHPGIMYGLFSRWDGDPIPESEVPLFYQGVSEETAAGLERLSREVLAVRQAVEGAGLPLPGVAGLHEWLRSSYRGMIEDCSSIFTCLTTNKGYRGLRAPVVSVGGGYCAPDFNHRYLAEDVPCGLAVTKALALLAGVATPTMDEVICWAAGKLGKEYVVERALTGRDVADLPIPQNYGVTTLNDLVRTVSEL